MERKLIGQGTYGCVYYPGIKCTVDTKSIVSKIVVHKPNSQSEIDIGKTIMGIPRYDDYFAPIIDSCKLDLAAVKKEEIEKCELTKKPGAFLTTSIRYVGQENVGDYLEWNVLGARRMLDYLLTALGKLRQVNIVHFDLKGNNIMVDAKLKVPIIIDFGLSFEMKSFPNSEWRHHFYDSYEKYPPWCLDITIISYLVKNEDLQRVVGDASVTKMMEMVKNHYSSPVLRETNFKRIKQWWLTYVSGLRKRTAQTVVDELSKAWDTWDTYAVSVMIYMAVKEKEGGKERGKEPLVKLLQENILSEPGKRKKPEELKALL